MMRRLFAPFLLSAVGGIGAMAAPAVIGLVTASGNLTVNHSPIWGNATLFEGTSVETGVASGDLALRNGVRIQLGAQSQAVVGESHTVLEKGSSQVRVGDAYEVQARGLKISGDVGARLLISLTPGNGVDVTALSGRVKVRGGDGVMVADVLEGRSIAFAMPQQAGGTTVTRTGCLLYKDMHFILQDDATTEVIELNGADLRTNTGRRVQITGAPTGAKPAVSIATGVMNVSNVAPISSGGCLTVASALDAKTEAPAAANSTAPNAPAAPAGTAPVEKHGMSTGAKAAIIIAVAGGGGAAAAIGISGGKKSTTSP